MIEIQCENLGKKFERKVIFRNFNHTFRSDKPAVIKGGNGSGKSTLLRMLSGAMTSTVGQITYRIPEEVPQEKTFEQIALAAPYQELIEELTLAETLKYWIQLRPMQADKSVREWAEEMYLEDSLSTEIRFFSSGMKQRLKLGLAFFTQTPILLLDEPLSNLDQRGSEWYAEQVQKYTDNRLVIVCSNDVQGEFFFCQDEIRMESFKAVDR
jgi:ABC-type multidrug transport system ATPase subunit